MFVRPKRITSSATTTTTTTTGTVKQQQQGGASSNRQTTPDNNQSKLPSATTGDLQTSGKLTATSKPVMALGSINSLASSSAASSSSSSSSSFSRLRRAQSSLQDQQTNKNNINNSSAIKINKLQQLVAPIKSSLLSGASRAPLNGQNSADNSDDQQQKQQQQSILNQYQFKLNQRVLVNSSIGLKPATLKYLGNTDFGAGVWAGVELEEPLGKNDGSVAGKRYFKCEPNYGLFAPVTKIQKLTSKLQEQLNKGGLTQQQQTSSSRNNIHTPSSSYKLNRSDSRDSVSSISSIRSTSSHLSGVPSTTSKLPVRSTSNLHTTYNYYNNDSKQQPTLSAFKLPLNPAPSTSAKMASTVTSTGTANSKTGPSNSMALRDKDQQIDLLIKERDSEREENSRLHRRLEELEERLSQAELDKSRMTNEADEEILELKRLTQELEDENRKLQDKLDQEKQYHGETQFKYDELEVFKGDLEQQLQDKDRRLSQMEQSLLNQSNGSNYDQSMPGSQLSLLSSSASKLDRSATTKAKFEKEIATLKEQIVARDEQLIQLRTSLEMRKNEVKNLQTRVVDIERNLKTETERNDRHLKKIDDINLELKASESKLAAKLEENQVYENQVRKLRNDLRNAEEKLEQLSLSKKKDVEILHNKLSLARRGSSTNTPTSPIPAHVSTPTPQDEMVRLQMEIRDLKDQLIDREAEVDFHKRELDLLKQKLDTRSSEVDSNNQELARRCQELLEQNRNSDDTVKQLMKSSTEHSQQLIRATEDLKEANGKCSKLREEIGELESNLKEQQEQNGELKKENGHLKQENEDYKDQLEALRQELHDLQQQLDDLTDQISRQSNNLDQDRDTFANRLSQSEKENSQLRHDLQTHKQDLRTLKNQSHDLQLERDRLKADLDIKEKYIESRNDIIETLRHELDDCKRLLEDHKCQLDQMQRQAQRDSDQVTKELRSGMDTLRKECQQLREENSKYKQESQQLLKKLDQQEKNQQQSMRDRGEQRQELESECKRLNALHKQSTEQLKQKSDKLHLLEQEHDQNLVDLESSNRKEREDLQERIRLLEKELDDMQRKLEKLKTEADEAKCKLAEEREQNQQQRLEMSSDITTGRGSQVSTKFIHHSATPVSTSSSSPQPLGSQTLGNNNRGGGSHSQSQMTLGEREEYETQIEFLNSVIVDMQKKCDEMKARVATLEEMNLEDFDVKSKEIKRLLARQKRMYCDYCERFDLHYTDNCNKYSTNNNNSNKMSHLTISGGPGSAKPLYESAQTLNRYENNGRHHDHHDDIGPTSNRYFQSLRRPATPRPYCDHCEMFGHHIDNCGFFKK